MTACWERDLGATDIRHNYDEEQKGKRSPFWIDSLKPIQLATFDLEEYRACAPIHHDEWD